MVGYFGGGCLFILLLLLLLNSACLTASLYLLLLLLLLSKCEQILRSITYKFVSYQISLSCFPAHTPYIYLLKYKKYTMERIVFRSIEFLHESTII